MTEKEWKDFSRYFKPVEFDSPDKLESGLKMKREFMTKLMFSRNLNSVKYKIMSGYRTRKHNKKVGGVAGSSHMKGLACDIKVKSSHDRFVILECLILAGFKRLGIGRTYIHVDFDESKPNRLAWLY